MLHPHRKSQREDAKGLPCCALAIPSTTALKGADDMREIIISATAAQHRGV